MKTVLSYCLFEPIQLHSHRTWDEHRLNQKRYWFNIPALYITNKILYPEYEMTIHVNDSLRYHPLYSIISSLGITAKEIEIPFEKTSEPMLWRMIPLWEDYDCVFTRDVDSLPNRNEFRSTVYFNSSDHALQTIRSHENHYHEMGCDMLGGLSGFKPKLIENKPNDFMSYYNAKNNLPWAQDQYLMVETFLTQQNRSFLETNFLDCPIDNQDRKSSYLHTTIPDSFSVELTKDQREVLDLIDEYKISTWAGEPCDTRGEFLEKMLKLNNEYSKEVKNVISTKDNLKSFYEVDV